MGAVLGSRNSVLAAILRMQDAYRKMLLLSAAGTSSVLLAFAIFYFWGNSLSSSLPAGIACPGMETKEEVVQGASLEPLVKDGATIQALLGYYACNPVARGDLILFRLVENENLLIKIAKGLPGDTLALERGEGGEYTILINGKKAVNSEGLPYVLNNARANMLSLYINDYDGTIPADSYLILGNVPSGSRDSTTFGLIAKSDIAGKAIIAEAAAPSLFTNVADIFKQLFCRAGSISGENSACLE